MKNIIITGASGNLGRVVTKKFLDLGYQVIATVIHEDFKADLVAHPNLTVDIVNLTNEGETTSFVQRIIDQYKEVDAALLLVGGFAAGDIKLTGAAELQKQFSLNFETAYFVTRPLFQHMMERGNGRLLYIGARSALKAADGRHLLAYALGKSLLFKLAEFLNEEAKGKNVTATVIVPSTLDTAENRKYMPLTNPENLVKPEQLADVLEFVISEKGSALRETILKVYNNV